MKTKDYIYLDENLLNSHLAQFEKGLLVLERSEHGVESSDAENGSNKVTAGLNGILGIGAKLQSEITEGDSSSESEFTKNMVENVLSDYAVDLLVENCKANCLIQDLSAAVEGEFVLFDSKFQIYDFEYLKNITDPQILSLILKMDTAPVKPDPQADKAAHAEYLKQRTIYENKTKSAKAGYNLVHDLSVFANALFDDSILVKTRGSLSLCKKNKLRLSKAQISFENESSRRIQILGVVSALKEETHPDGGDIDFNPTDLDKISSLLFDVLLSNFSILRNGDKIIKPIAIYFGDD